MVVIDVRDGIAVPPLRSVRGRRMEATTRVPSEPDDTEGSDAPPPGRVLTMVTTALPLPTDGGRGIRGDEGWRAPPETGKGKQGWSVNRLGKTLSLKRG
mmetsp:Transcript_26676/g.41270  ORF Transcript_26676/g.41270 Transcript_26676/m.41270 type:complete len:99 (-) Transcript_26676:317-613(-)